MSIYFKAKGTPSVGILFIRLVLGSYFLVLGIMQSSNIEAYINKVKAMGVLSDNMAFISGFLAPFLLIIFGALYIMGFFTPVTSLILSVIIILKIIARGFLPGHGVPFTKDMIFLACTITTLFGGAGVFSFDMLLDRKKKEGKKEEKTVTSVSPPISAPLEDAVVTETKTEV